MYPGLERRPTSVLRVDIGTCAEELWTTILFLARLPFSRGRRRPTTPAESGDAPWPSPCRLRLREAHRMKTILVIDDDSDIRELVMWKLA
ncbi:MAG: hypothetical protein LC749_05200, partial [Actinobacteria bacterium]|nr:hypothetical protein [Actinomycetota bacterium]